MGFPFSAPGGDEEALNRQFAGLLSYSLEIGPDLLNGIHRDEPITYTSEAELVADQESPLPKFTASGSDRELDWVVGDRDKLVGYESKYGDSLGETQLSDELDKLRLNADGRDVMLVAVTPHTTRPAVVDEFADEPVCWTSWTTVSRRLGRIEERDVPAEQRPILRMLNDLFEAEDMHPFSGFDHRDKEQYRYFIRDLRQELQGTELENRGEVHSWTTSDPDPPSYRRIVPKYLEVPFVRGSRDGGGTTKRASYLTVTVDTETHEVHAGIAFNVREVARHEEYVDANVDELVDYATEEDLELWASMNSPNQWKLGVPKTDDPAEMRTWLTSGSRNAVRVDDTDYKKARFVSECPAEDPASLVLAVQERVLAFYEDFLRSDELYPWPTLGEGE